jgi:hypothetical protein
MLYTLSNGETTMPKTSKVSKEKAANLLDQVQMDDELFVTEDAMPQQAVEPTEPVADIVEAPQPLPMSQATEQPTEEAAVESTPAKVDGFSALLDHLKCESLRNNAKAREYTQSRPRRRTRRHAA